MEPQSTESNTPNRPKGSLTLQVLACITATIVIVGSAYPIARYIVAWLGPYQ